MIAQLLNLAEDHLHGISHNIPELNDLDSNQVTSVTSETVVNTIVQQARKGNVDALREMLSGSETAKDHEVIRQLENPVINQLQSKLNISDQTAKQLAVIALPVVMNLLNGKVKHAQTGGFDINDAIRGLNGNSGMLKGVFNLFGGNKSSTKTINSILQNLIG